jgi:hypothetical protein
VRDELEIPVHLGRRIEEYFEDEEGAGIVLDTGERVSRGSVAARFSL